MIRKKTTLAALLSVAAASSLLLPGAAVAQNAGATVSGVFWSDFTGDGVRQEHESALSGENLPSHLMLRLVDTVSSREFTARPDASGEYRIEGVPAGEYYLQTIDYSYTEGRTLTRPGADSKFDWVTYRTPVTVTEADTEITGLDAGYNWAPRDYAITNVSASADPASLKVGDRITYTFDVTNLAAAPLDVIGSVDFPEALRVTEATGGMWTWGRTNAGFGPYGKALPGGGKTGTITFVADAPVESGALTFTAVYDPLLGETNRENNVVSTPLTVAP